MFARGLHPHFHAGVALAEEAQAFKHLWQLMRVTRHTSHVTRHTSHVTRHLLQLLGLNRHSNNRSSGFGQEGNWADMCKMLQKNNAGTALTYQRA